MNQKPPPLPSVDPVEVETAKRRDEALNAQSRAWTLAANGGGLLLCLNALLSRQICDWQTFQPIAVAFAVGMFATFASLMADTFASRIVGLGMLYLQQFYWSIEQIRKHKAELEHVGRLPAEKREAERNRLVELIERYQSQVRQLEK